MFHVKHYFSRPYPGQGFGLIARREHDNSVIKFDNIIVCELDQPQLETGPRARIDLNSLIILHNNDLAANR